MKTKIYYANANVLETKPKNGKKFTLKELQTIVGGYIEIVHLNAGDLPDAVLVCNEEGKLNKLPENHVATAILRQYTGGTDFIVGDALICSPDMID